VAERGLLEQQDREQEVAAERVPMALGDAIQVHVLDRRKRFVQMVRHGQLRIKAYSDAVRGLRYRPRRTILGGCVTAVCDSLKVVSNPLPTPHDTLTLCGGTCTPAG
jgi:hypothetical protein